jgi:hypothetical protein
LSFAKEKNISICSVAYLDLYGNRKKTSADVGLIVGKIEGWEKMWNILIQSCQYWPPLTRDIGALSKLLYMKDTT